MPPNNDEKSGVSTTGSPLLLKTPLQISDSSLIDNHDENNKTEHCNGVDISTNSMVPSHTIQRYRYIKSQINGVNFIHQ